MPLDLFDQFDLIVDKNQSFCPPALPSFKIYSIDLFQMDM